MTNPIPSPAAVTRWYCGVFGANQVCMTTVNASKICEKTTARRFTASLIGLDNSSGERIIIKTTPLMLKRIVQAFRLSV